MWASFHAFCPKRTQFVPWPECFIIPPNPKFMAGKIPELLVSEDSNWLSETAFFTRKCDISSTKVPLKIKKTTQAVLLLVALA